MAAMRRPSDNAAVSIFTAGRPSFGTGLLGKNRAQVSFQHEKGSTEDPKHTVPILGQITVHKNLDMALLEVPKLGRPAVKIDTAALSEGRRIAAIGYPAKDSERNPIFAPAIFGTNFGVKRAALGEVLDGTKSPDVFHDCSTLGGNSGSPLFSIETGLVVGIHRAGFFMYRNEAVDGASLDSFVSR